MLTQLEVWERLKQLEGMSVTKIHKKVHRLYLQAQQTSRDGLLSDILCSKNPWSVIAEAIDKQESHAAVLRELIEDGNHGMVIYKGEAYGIELSLETPDDLERAVENENITAIDCAHKFMAEQNLGHIDCTVVLFQNHGFSGVSRPVELSCVTSGGKNLIKIEGTPYVYQGTRIHDKPE